MVLLRGGAAQTLNIRGAYFEVFSDLLSSVGVMHDLHVWSLTSGVNALSAHVVAAAECDRDRLLRALHRCARDTFGIAHVTIQLEAPGWDRGETHF